jgi:hypothetical protein
VGANSAVLTNNDSGRGLRLPIAMTVALPSRGRPDGDTMSWLSRGINQRAANAGPVFDWDGDGDVDAADFGKFRGQFGKTLPPP